MSRQEKLAVQCDGTTVYFDFQPTNRFSADPLPYFRIIHQVLTEAGIPIDQVGRFHHERLDKGAGYPTTDASPVHVRERRNDVYRFVVLPVGKAPQERHAFTARISYKKKAVNMLEELRKAAAVINQSHYSDKNSDVPTVPEFPLAKPEDLAHAGLQLQPTEPEVQAPQEPEVYDSLREALCELVTDEGLYVTEGSIDRFMLDRFPQSQDTYKDAIKVMLGRNEITNKQYRGTMHYRLSVMNGLDSLRESEARCCQLLMQKQSEEGSWLARRDRDQIAKEINNKTIDPLLHELKQKGFIQKDEKSGLYELLKDRCIVYTGKTLTSGETWKLGLSIADDAIQASTAEAPVSVEPPIVQEQEEEVGTKTITGQLLPVLTLPGDPIHTATVLIDQLRQQLPPGYLNAIAALESAEQANQEAIGRSNVLSQQILTLEEQLRELKATHAIELEQVADQLEKVTKLREELNAPSFQSHSILRAYQSALITLEMLKGETNPNS
jgi:hypothetical protein